MFVRSVNGAHARQFLLRCVDGSLRTCAVSVVATAGYRTAEPWAARNRSSTSKGTCNSGVRLTHDALGPDLGLLCRAYSSDGRLWQANSHIGSMYQ